MDVPEPMYIAERLSVWFSEMKCHRKSRKIKPIKRRFLKMYGKEAEVFFEMCFTPPKCRKY